MLVAFLLKKDIILDLDSSSDLQLTFILSFLALIGLFIRKYKGLR
jgi:hypothetical protein